MKKNLLIICLIFLLSSCALKTAKQNLSSGDYDAVITTSVEKLIKNKTKKKNQEYILLAEDAFAKAKDRDLRQIDFLMKDANPRNLEQVYNTFINLNRRQEKLRPLLPLKITSENRNANFVFEDYSEQMINSKNALVKYLYDNSKGLLGTNSKVNFRRAYDDLMYINQLQANYKDVNKLIIDAKNKGMDYVEVYSNNQTNKIIPKDLLYALLDFDTYGLNEKWITYHNIREKNIQYNYAIDINFREINISPEQIKEKEFVLEKEIIDGKIAKVNSRGIVEKDSLGRTIYVDNIKLVKARVNEFLQSKSVQVIAKIDYVDLKTNKIIQTFPIQSEFIFQHIYARYRGDIRAVDVNYQVNFKNRPVPFPTNEQMVFDTGEDLKNKVKSIIQNNKIVK